VAYVNDFLARKGDDISKLFAPAFLVGKRFVEERLTAIHVNPSLPLIDVDFGPDVVSPIKHLSSLMAKRNTEASECISPFSAPARSCLKKFHWMVISWEPCMHLAVLAIIVLDSCSMHFSFLCSWCDISQGIHVFIAVTLDTFGLIAPSKEIILEPFQKNVKLIHLICGLMYLLRYTRHGDALSHFIVVEISIFNATFDPEFKLLRLKHVHWYLLVC
jgi:hypothetical protein